MFRQADDVPGGVWRAGATQPILASNDSHEQRKQTRRAQSRGRGGLEIFGFSHSAAGDIIRDPFPGERVVVSSSWSLTLRVIALLAFLAAMPVLALPTVNEWIDDRLFGVTSKSDAAAPPAATVVASSRDPHESLPGPLRKPADDSPPPAPRTRVDKGERDNEPTLAKTFSRLPPTEPHVDSVRYQSVQQRLQELGVDYFVLEKSASDAPSYRFHCRIAVPGSTVYARPFEINDADPLHAMERALADVESWCASHQTGRRTLR